MNTYCPMSPSKTSQILLHVLGGEREELRHDVELGPADDRAHRVGIPHVRDELADAARERPARGPAVEHGHIVTALERTAHARSADGPGSADVQDASTRHRSTLARGCGPMVAS